MKTFHATSLPLSSIHWTDCDEHGNLEGQVLRMEESVRILEPLANQEPFFGLKIKLILYLSYYTFLGWFAIATDIN